MTVIDTPTLTFERINGRIGAVASGIDLRAPISADTGARIKAAVHEHKVVFFRGQHDLDEAGLVRLGEAIGEVTEGYPAARGRAEFQPVGRVDSEKWLETRRHVGRSGPNFWHTDVTFVHQPPAYLALQPQVLPPYGGDTAWSNTATAYADLPEPLRALADRLWAVHSTRRGYADPRSSDELPPIPGADPSPGTNLFWGNLFESVHPVVQVHPDTGERALLLGVHLRHLLGLDGKVAAEVLDALQYQVERLENQIRWRWQLGDLALFDNRTTQHYAVSDYDDHHRLLHSLSVKGAPPVSVDGRSSHPRVGDSTVLDGVLTPIVDDRPDEEGRNVFGHPTPTGVLA